MTTNMTPEQGRCAKCGERTNHHSEACKRSMTPEQEQEVLKLASECGAVPLGDQTSFDGKKWVDTVRLVFNQESLTSFASKLRIQGCRRDRIAEEGGFHCKD